LARRAAAGIVMAEIPRLRPGRRSTGRRVMYLRSYVTAVAATFAAMALATAAQAQDMSKYPDWSGQWRRPANVAPSWDPTKPPGLGQEAPLTPEYQKLFEAILKDRAVGGLTGDPTGLCLPHGLPRMMVAIFPVEFVVTPKITYYMTDYTTSRRIFTDGRDWPKDLMPSFNGYSIGKWVDTDGDGRYDTLEVETRNLKGPRQFDNSGLPLHPDNQTVVKERIFGDKTNPDLLHNELTTYDHVLTRPWTVMKNYRRDRVETWPDDNCSENNNHVEIGKEGYFLSAEGILMPTRKDQPPPDLRYFKQTRK
jgi:hypothetical protein